MKTILLIIGITLISCSKVKNRFIYKYQYTTEQSNQYKESAKMKDFFVTSIGEYNKILNTSEVEAERVNYRNKYKANSIKIISDTFYITNY